jgi:iron complex outermembrane recepter protein
VQLAKNIERIDVLKGPSGFLYGFNSPGGTINYIIKRPTQDPFVTATVGSSTLEQRSVAVDGSTSVLDGALGFRLNTGYEKTGSFSHAKDFERSFFGIATDVRLSERALLQLNADWSKKSTVADPLLRADQSTRANPLDPDTYILPPRIDPRDLLTGGWYRHQTENINFDGKFELTLSEGWISVTQANYSRVERHGGYTDLFDIQPNGDIGFGDLALSRGEVFDTATVQSYGSGKFQTGRIKHDFFFGAAHRAFGDRSPFWDYVDTTGPLGIGGITVGNILDPVQPPPYDFGPEQPIEYDGSIEETSVFASDLLSISDRFQLLLGGRYIWYRADNLSATALPQRKNVFVPAGALMYRPARDVLTYVSYSKGFEKGDYAPFSAVNGMQPTDSIASRQYEIGVKADVSSGVALGLAAFDIVRDASYLNSDNYFVSNGRYHHRGVELTAVGQVTRAFSLLSSLAWLDTELEDVADEATLGKRSDGVPEWKASLGARYALTTIPGISVDATLNYVASRPVDAQNSGFMPSFTLLDAGMSYETQLAGTPVQLRVLARNLFNEYFYTEAVAGALDVGRPREVFLTAKASF